MGNRPADRISSCQETGESFEENAIQKATYSSRHAAGLLFAEDSGLEVDALAGAPGVRSARFAGEGASDEDDNRLLMEKLRGVGDRSARYVCDCASGRGPGAADISRRNSGRDCRRAARDEWLRL